MRASLPAAALIFALSAGIGFAHHGWRWAEDGNFELTGTIREARLGNPHGLLTVDANGEAWTVEVGQPWRNEQAGLTDDKLKPGVELTASGHRSSDPAQRLMKAERITIDGTVHNLYPDRD
ncbi:DUF6152 family protein [Chthonobacter rhizosphaerae]|uniref:DUF6152 family protein n=1 Tax=Chthonobacter rhizosphaerae TaxID=2735553 RepID=UPI0015EF42D7|nr:DUF6152 family protein [Chthonobacter rhizosphaerae]